MPPGWPACSRPCTAPPCSSAGGARCARQPCRARRSSGTPASPSSPCRASRQVATPATTRFRKNTEEKPHSEEAASFEWLTLKKIQVHVVRFEPVSEWPRHKVEDFYFDDVAWVIRYLVVETGSWLSSREVLISPIAIGRPNSTEKLLPAAISRDQIRNSPDIDTKKPVSRQHEIGYLGYYGYPNYWGGSGLWGGGMYPCMSQAKGEGAGLVECAVLPA